MISLIEPDAIYSTNPRQADLEDIRQGLERVDQLVEGAMADVRAMYDYIDSLERQLLTRRPAPLSRGTGSKIMLVSSVGGQGGYSRQQPSILVKWVCAVCGKHNQRSQLPGPAPKYCQPREGENLSLCQRAARRDQRIARCKLQSVTELASSITAVQPTEI